MHITVFHLGPLGANCYVIADEEAKSCAVVDPCGQGKALADWLNSQKLTPKYVFLTHGHYDHVGGAKELADCYDNLPVYLHPNDRTLAPYLCQGLYWTHAYDEGDVLPMDSLSFRILHTPGHSKGSVCIQAEDALFTGDTLFAGSCGRTDFPDGSWQEILRSLGRLADLSGDLRVLPGHESDSTLERERNTNPYMKEATKR